MFGSRGGQSSPVDMTKLFHFDVAFVNEFENNRDRSKLPHFTMSILYDKLNKESWG
jgi:hypothetical protein